MIYSFRGERLAEHSYLVLRLYCEAFGSAHERLIAKRLDIDPYPVSVAMRAACLLHDVGKALTEYQHRIVQGWGAPFHEIVSAYATYYTLCNALSRQKPAVRNALSFAATCAVLQHHQAMRSFQEVLESWCQLPLASGIDTGVVEEVELAAHMAEHLFDAREMLEALKKIIDEASSREQLHKFVNHFRELLGGKAPASVGSEWGATWGRLQRLLPLFTAPLQLCDYLAAYITRGGRPRALHREALIMLRNALRNLPTSTSAPTSRASTPGPTR